MIDFFTEDNWIRNLLLLLVPVGILVVGIISLLKKPKQNTGKRSSVNKSKRVSVTQTGEGDSSITGSEDVTINQ